MKQVGGCLFAIGSAVGLCFVGSATASLMIKPQTNGGMPVRLMDVTDLWTTTPVKVDPSRQPFERVASIAPIDPPAPARVVAAVTPALQPAVYDVPQMSQDHLAWCSQRYRSYDATTNTYRSFSGQVKICASPYETAMPKLQAASALPAEHVSWCEERYRSYRAEDNTYRSYSGQQRDCVSPYIAQTVDVASQP